MNKCYDPDGRLCNVIAVDDRKIRYEARRGGETWCSHKQHAQRVDLYGPIPEPISQDAPGGTYVGAAAAMALKKAPMAGEADVVRKPSHYQVFDGTESIEVIAMSFTEAEFRGFCFGNVLKYRLRAGNKDKLEQDIAKADFYKELFDKHKHLCREA